MATLAEQLEDYWSFADSIANGQVQRDALNRTALELKNYGLRQMRSTIGNDLTLHNYPRGKRTRPRKAGIGYDIRDTSLTFKFRPGGLWSIVEDGTTPHRIGNTRRTAKNTTVNVRKARVTRGEHPGTQSLGDPIRQTQRRVDPIWQDSFAEVTRKRLP